jgi:hypothetical protein
VAHLGVGREPDADQRDKRRKDGLERHAWYGTDVPRWLAVVLGCITALGMQALFGLFAAQVQLTGSVVAPYISLFLALGLAGYVTGHLVGRAQVFYGALMAIVFIMLTTTVQATGEAILAHEAGLRALPPIDLIQLTLIDVLAMGGASLGGWVASRI